MATTAITPRKRLLLLIALLYHLPAPSTALLIPPLPSEGAGLFLSSGNGVLSDYGLIKATQFNTTHGVWCQSSSNTSNLTVTWYLPNGAQVPTSPDPSLPVYAYSNSTGQAGLLRTGLLGNHQGLYNCLVRNGSTGTIISSLFVAAIRDTEYNSAVGSRITGGVDFSLLSPRGSQDVAFSLSFNVSARPPTDVSCTLNSSIILISPNEIEREVLGSTLDNLLVQVTVTIRLRKAGQYKCTVTNSRVDDTFVFPEVTDNAFISVTDPPLNANATRTGLTSLTVRWSPPPPPLSSPLLGYEVFYAYNATVGEGKVKEMLNSVLVSNITYQVVLDQLLFDKNYQIFVIAFGGDLPSQHSNMITTSTGVDFTFISLPPPPPLFGDTNISLVCEVSVNITQLSFGLLWLGPQLDVISNDSTDVLSQFGHSRRRIEIIIDLIDSNNVGLYACMAIFHSNNVTVSRGYELIAQAPELSVTLYALYNDELIEGTYTDLICNASNIDTSLTNVTWYYNEEPLVNGSDYTIGLKEGRQALTINQLSFSRDNGGVYKCVMTVPNSTYVIGTEDSANITLSVQRFVSSHISISVVFSEQIPVYGSNFTMQCLVVLPERFVSQPTKLSAQSQESIPFGTPPFRDIHVSNSRVTNEGLVGNGKVYAQNNVFSPILARDTDVKYRCSVTVNGITKNSNEFDLRIQLSPPVLSFESQTLMVYESTRLVIRCNVVTPTFDYDVLEEGQWRGPGGEIITETDRIEITGSTGHNSFDTNVLTINPADNGDFSQYNDTGFYTYNSTFDFPAGSKILPASSQATIYVNIIDLPPLQVSINASGSSYFGQNVTLSCSIVPIPGLQISIKWIHERMALANNSDKSSTATLSLNNLIDRMSGVYTCEASYNISRTNDNSTVQEDYQLIVGDLGSPQNFRVTEVTPFLIQVSWDSPPMEVYGIFNSYRLYISYSNGSNDSIVPLVSSETMFQLEGLSPYQMIQFKLSVVYPIGEGPAVTLNQTTHQDKSSPVVDLTLRYNTSHLVINWSPPLQPNGRIEYYTLTLKEYEGMIVQNVTININSLLSVAINGLESGVPYELTVHPVNGIGLGEREYRRFFVEEKSPSAVSNVTLNRVNGTHAIVTWSQLSLTESRGFLQNYTIEYSIAADRGKRQVRTTTVPSNQSNVTLYDLTPSKSYEVSVFASTNAGPGTASQPEILDRPITLKFQVQVRPNTTCSVTDESLKEAIRSSIVNTLASNCSCSFQEEYISGEIFTCADDGSAYYRANVTSFGATNSSKLVEYIKTWVSTSPRIQMGSLIFSFDPACPTQYSSNDDPACRVPPSETPTDNDDNNNMVLIIVVIVVVMVMLLVLIIISGIIVYYLYRKNKSKTQDHLEMHPHFANYYKGEIKRSDMIPEEEEDEIYEPLDPDGNLMPAALNKRGASVPLFSTLPLPPPPTTATSTAQQSAAQAFKSNRTQSMIVTSSTPTRLLPLPPIPPTESGTTVSSSSVPMNGEKAGPHAALSESLPFQLGGTKVSSPINFVPGLGSLSEENEDSNRRNTIIAGAKGNKPKPFSISSSGGSVHSMSSKRASQLTTISQSMSDRGPVSPSGTTASINSPATPSSAMSPQYSTPFSPLYANADEKGGGQKGGREGIRNKDVKTNKEEEEDQYISMKSPAYTEVKKIPPSSSSAHEYTIPVVSSGSFEKLLGVADVQAHEYETPVSSRGGTPVPTVRPGGGGGGGGEVRSMSPPSRDRISSTNSISSRDGASFSIDESGLYSRPIFPNIYQESNNEVTGTPQEYEVPVLSPSHRSPPPTASGSDWLYAEPHLHASPMSPTRSDSLAQNYLVPVFTKPHSSTSSSPPPSLPQLYEVPIVSSRETTPKSPSPPPTSPPPPATSPPPPATSPPPPATSPPPLVTSPEVPSPASSPPDSPTPLASPKVPLRDLEVETGKHEEKQPPEADKVIPDTEEENKAEQEMEKEKEDHSKEEEASNNGKEAENASTEGVKAEVEEANEEKELKEGEEIKQEVETDEDEEKQPPEADKVMVTDEDEEKQPPEADKVIHDTEEENKAEQEMDIKKEDHNKEEAENVSTEGVKAEEDENEEVNEKELNEVSDLKDEVAKNSDSEESGIEADEDNENGDSDKELDEDPIINNSLMKLENGKVEKELTNDTKGDTSGMNGKPISGETFHDGNDEEIGTKL